MNIALLQLPPISPTDNRLEKYFQVCKKQHTQLLAIGEYVFNPFYREFNVAHSKEMINAFSQEILSTLQKFSKKHKIDILAPLLLGEGSKLYKSIVLIQNNKLQIYHPQRLIAYEHWNEKAFFDNPTPKVLKTPLIFEKEHLKIAAISGFEAHFDEIWIKLKKAKVDVVIMSCANTFESISRWRMLCQMRAFCNSMVILRANRIGDVYYDGVKWRFYGDSLYINASGYIEDSLEDKEGVMLIPLNERFIREVQEEWGFR